MTNDDDDSAVCDDDDNDVYGDDGNDVRHRPPPTRALAASKSGAISPVPPWPAGGPREGS